MGGRGSSSGVSVKGIPYGSEYTSVLNIINIKFLKKNDGSSTAPLETMTKGRVYVTINDENRLKSISYYDNNNKRMKQIDLDHYHKVKDKNEKPHKHLGYYHNEKGDSTLSYKESKMVDFVNRVWNNRTNKK
ncbi:MAG: hypothetical protein GYA87_03780 [Christensenellaceae bacterium]|nr:hypothetical protein [Christensenellaceae bacterium]